LKKGSKCAIIQIHVGAWYNGSIGVSKT